MTTNCYQDPFFGGARVHCAVPETRSATLSCLLRPAEGVGGGCWSHLHRVTATMAKGKRPAPFRTRKLSLSAPMVLHGRLCGRVGRRRTYLQKGLCASAQGPFCMSAHVRRARTLGGCRPPVGSALDVASTHAEGVATPGVAPVRRQRDIVRVRTPTMSCRGGDVVGAWRSGRPHIRRGPPT